MKKHAQTFVLLYFTQANHLNKRPLQKATIFITTIW